MTRLGPLLSPVLVGRDDLLDQADRRVAEAAAGRGRLVLLAGEAGDQVLPFNTQIGLSLLWVSALVTIYTGYDYFRAGIHHLIEEDAE